MSGVTAEKCAAVYLLWSAGPATGAVLVQYEFSQDECRRGTAEDVAGGQRYFGDMILDKSTTSCLPGIGMERTSATPGSPGASSVGNTTLLREELSRDSSSPGRFSLELWLSIDRMAACDSFCTTPLVTIGERGVSIDDDCQENMGMMITYWIETGEIGARFQSTRDSCERLWSGAVQPPENMGSALHLVLTVDKREFFGDSYAYFEWFINGTRVAWDLSQHVPLETMMTSWDSGFNLQLLDSSRQIPSSLYREGPGIKIFFLAIHNETLSSTEILSRYSARVRNSAPVVRDTSVDIAEDGENGDHYGEPEFYLQVVPHAELQLIPLDVYDSDNDPATPNYEDTSPRVFVSKLPFPGSLVSSSDENIVSAPFEVFGEDGVFNVRYRPILNDFSTNVTANDAVPYANFSFYATDEEEFTRSHTNATVSIYVYPKNDPPEAFTASHDVYAGTRNNVLPLQGTDMDPFDDVHGAAIVESPAKGSLFQVFENGSASNVAVTAGQLLWRQFVAYEHDVTWLSSNSPEEQTVGSDAFSFKVFDSHYNFSVPAVVNITVRTGVNALDQEGLWQCYEETNCDVRLYGSAIDDNGGNLSITVTSVTAYGSFLNPVTNGSIEVGVTLSDFIQYPYEIGASVIYRPPTNFFTDPATEWNGTQLPPRGPVLISFYASVEVGNAKLSSTEVTQGLKVINVNDNSTIACEKAILQTQASGVVADDLTFDYARPDQLFMYDFFITEEDSGVDPIRVSIEVEYGYLTLNDTPISRVSFEHLCSGTRDWRCTGDGTRFQSMVFVGAPKDVQNVLNGMLFVSYKRNLMDNMTVTIYDGFEGDCIWEFSTPSVRPTCFSSSCSVLINVTETWLGVDPRHGLRISLYQFLALFALICALLSLLARFCLKSSGAFVCYCCRLRKRGRIEVRQVKQKQRGIVVDLFTSTSFSSSRRAPAKIPAGRTEKKGAVKEVHKVCPANAEKYSFWGLDVLRRCKKYDGCGSSVAATQDMPHGHLEPSDEMIWEESD